MLMAGLLLSVTSPFSLIYSDLNNTDKALSIGVCGALVCSTGILYLIGWYVRRKQPVLLRQFPFQHRFRMFLVSTAFGVFVLVWILRDVNAIQVGGFAGISIILFICFVAAPKWLRGSQGKPGITDHLKDLWAYRVLLVTWLQYNVAARYSQTILGILWIMLVPLSTALVLALVFSQFFDRADIGGMPYVCFFLAGVVPWTLFHDSIHKGTVAIESKLGIISQVYFPREVLVLISLGESLIDTFFMFVAMLAINALNGIWPNALYVLLPLLLLIQVCLSLGLSLFLSYMTVLIPDIPQLVGIALRLLFYTTPIIYQMAFMPSPIRDILSANPLSPLIETYRDIIIYARMPDLSSLFYPLVMSVIALYLGYIAFKANEEDLADFV